MNMNTKSHLLIPRSRAEVNLFDDTSNRILVNRIALEATMNTITQSYERILLRSLINVSKLVSIAISSE